MKYMTSLITQVEAKILVFLPDHIALEFDGQTKQDANYV